MGNQPRNQGGGDEPQIGPKFLFYAVFLPKVHKIYRFLAYKKSMKDGKRDQPRQYRICRFAVHFQPFTGWK